MATNCACACKGQVSDRMRRVLFLTPAYPPFTGGGEHYASTLATHLAQAGTAVTVITSHASREQDFWRGVSRPSAWEQHGQIPVLRLPIRPFPAGWQGLLAYRKLMVLISAWPGAQSRLLARMARRIPPIHGLQNALAELPPEFDLVHGFNISWEWPLWAGWQWAQQHRLPFVATPFMHFGTGKDRVARNTTMDHQRRLLVAADGVLALTDREKAGLVRMGVAAARITVVGGGVGTPPPIGNTEQVQQQHQLGAPYALFIGRASYEKGAIHAAQAILSLRQQDVNMSLGLIGQPAPEFVRFYGRLSPIEQQWIRPLGILRDEEKHTLLAGAVVLLLPSRTDSFGIVLLEAWAHGVPVIGALAGGIPAVIDHEQNGLLVPFADVPALSAAIHRLYRDRKMAFDLGANGRAKVQRVFTWEQVTKQTLHRYQTLWEGRT